MTSLEQVKAAVAETETALAGTGRVLLRPSGTEPVVRVMVEGESAEQVEALCQQLADQVENIIQTLVCAD